jgi:hypothetical protein
MPYYVNVTKTYDTVPCIFSAADIKHNSKVGQGNPIITLTACSSHTINTSESCWLHKFIACEFEVAMNAVVYCSSPLGLCLSVDLDYYYILQGRMNKKYVSK